MIKSTIVFGLSAALLAGSAAAQVPGAYAEPTEVAPITVTADVAPWNLTVTVGGDVSEAAMVTSAPLGMNCGGGFYRFEQMGRSPQCWLHVRNNRRVLLTASAEGRYGADWTVEWVGCEPRAGGPACEVQVTENAAVAAVFKRVRPA